MTVQPLQIGESVFVAALGERAQRVRVVNRLGNYVVLENGAKFHILDDRKSPGIWYYYPTQSTITQIQN